MIQRLELPETERFDLMVATNVLVYYDVFEQSLALSNIASMLREGGWLLSNNALAELPGVPMTSAGYSEVSYTSQAEGGDSIIWYRRH